MRPVCRAYTVGMASKLVFTAITSLDGYVVDADGSFDWSVPSDEVHQFVNDLERPIGTYLYGRRLYEVMRAWETIDVAEGPMHDFAKIWRAAEKIVYSTTLAPPADAPRTTLRPRFDPVEVRHLLDTTDRDVSIGGPTLAASALRAGLVDEIQQLISPVVVGGGIRFLPDDVRIDLELIDERRFENGVVFVRYAVTR